MGDETPTVLNYVYVKWQPSETGEQVASINPADRREVVGFVERSRRCDLDRAVAAAKEAQIKWRKLTGPARGEYLYRTAAIQLGCGTERRKKRSENYKTRNASRQAAMAVPQNSYR